MTGAPRPPIYARALRLRHLRLSSLSCFVLFEGMIAVAVLLALAELVSWWAVLALPAAAAVMVKLNDALAGVLGAPARSVPRGGAARSTGRRSAPRAAAAGAAAHGGGAGSVWQRESGAGELGVRGRFRAESPARQVSRDLGGAMDPVDSPQQRLRQSARRRYE